MSKILIVSIIAMSMLTISCNENDFSSGKDLLSKIESGEVTEQEVADATPSEEEVIAVMEVMEADEVLEEKEPIAEAVSDEVMASKYACLKKPKKIKKKKKCNKKKHAKKRMDGELDIMEEPDTQDLVASEDKKKLRKKKRSKRNRLERRLAKQNSDIAKEASSNAEEQEMVAEYLRNGLSEEAAEKRVMLCVLSSAPDKGRTICMKQGLIDRHLQNISLKTNSSVSTYLGPCKRNIKEVEKKEEREEKGEDVVAYPQEDAA